MQVFKAPYSGLPSRTQVRHRCGFGLRVSSNGVGMLVICKVAMEVLIREYLEMITVCLFQTSSFGWLKGVRYRFRKGIPIPKGAKVPL